jgi:hypothetical protein
MQDKYKRLPEGEVFYFDQNENRIVQKEEIDFTYCNRVEDDDYVSMRFWEIPLTFMSDFIANPEKAKRDYGAIPSYTLEGLFPMPSVIDNMFSNRADPVEEDGSYLLEEPLPVPHFIHVDLALNKDGRGDYAGFCLCRYNGTGVDPISGEKYIKVYVELLEQIKAGPKKEIQFAEVRQRIYDLQKFGYRIHSVSYDGWQCTRRNTKIPIVNCSKLEYSKNTILNQDNMKKNSKLPKLGSTEKNIQDLKKGDYVYSLDKTGNIVAGEVLNVWCSGKKVLWRVILDNGEFIECSGNHPFMLRSGAFIRADELKKGDSLMPLYRRRGKYERVYNPRTNNYKAMHRLIMKASDGKHVHHKDGNSLNNHPDNLVILSPSEHAKGHWTPERREEAAKRMKETNEKYGLMGHHGAQSEETKVKIKNILKDKWKNDKAYREKMKKRPIYSGKESTRYDKSINIDILSQYKDKKLKEVCKILGTTGGVIRRRLKDNGYNTWEEFKKQNHKVIKVECLGIEDEVWDIEIKDHHNFAVSAGVFVHNSSDSIQMLKSKGIRAEYLSVDRTVEPYFILKEAINMKRLDMYPHPVLARELKHLELIKGSKVDHAPGFKKDCLAGDTKISLLNGDEIPIRELIGKEFEVYSCLEDGTVKIGKAYNVHKVSDLPIIRIWLDNGEKLECTEDHEIMLRDGSFIEACNLKGGDSLMSYPKRDTKIVKIEKNVGTVDVYDMTVDKYHNFAISSGIFVHNCADALAGAVSRCITTHREVGMMRG